MDSFFWLDIKRASAEELQATIGKLPGLDKEERIGGEGDGIEA